MIKLQRVYNPGGGKTIITTQRLAQPILALASGPSCVLPCCCKVCIMIRPALCIVVPSGDMGTVFVAWELPNRVMVCLRA